MLKADPAVVRMPGGSDYWLSRNSVRRPQRRSFQIHIQITHKLYYRKYYLKQPD